ncbi:molybdopterin-guanine dinucleotide biosynthesis protein A [Fusobacterium necrogenes]|uniref:Molybdopterin-guanine dinucleotide biosynthesis protein A n=1 Tax=Fusobacterium necrogenes TaxID=858 RepID=A0A377GUY5_9FUSO|nr:selenium cofactor biosynthesis protein YqeC [Fusobacterium necrogenes]STO30778.1 molybdopterin-guanine dinucleotide biosynthesis protein A [Fusobacterium necrogenes]
MLVKVFDIKKGDVITITGAGGKTSLMFSLARELSVSGKVLITTTTKIFLPKPEEFEVLITANNKIKGLSKNIFVYGEKLENNKLYSPSYDKIYNLKKEFDYILIEGDGAKEKKIKAWSDTEPCIPPFSTKTIGVINLDILNLKLEKNNIHRFEIFKEKFSLYINKIANKYFLKDYIKFGDFFKCSSNTNNYLFFNGIDGDNYLEKFSQTLEICNQLKKENCPYNFILGSLYHNYFFKYIPTDAIVMASGYSKRMGKNKLQLPYRDTNLLGYTLEKLSFLPFYNIYVCGREKWVKDLTKNFGYNYLENKRSQFGQSESIKLGINNSSGEGIVFFTADQPLLTKNTLLKIYFNFLRYNYITIPRAEGQSFSPVFFPKNKREDLLKLEGDTGGREIIKKTALISFVDFQDKKEFLDIDTPEEYQNILSYQIDNK